MRDADDVRLHNPVVSVALADVLKKALTRDRNARFQTAGAYLEALVAASEGVLTARHLALSGARRVIEPPVVGDRPATLAAMSTVAAPSGSTPDARRSPRVVYVAIAGLALAVGAIAAVVAVPHTSNPLNGTPPSPAAVLAPGPRPTVAVTTSATAAIADAVPPIATASATAEGSTRVAPVAAKKTNRGRTDGKTDLPGSATPAPRNGPWNSPLELQEQ